MAERRMFTMKIADSDAFLDMPLSAQALYFHLNMRADDDGFVSNPKRIQKMTGASDDDMKLLMAKRFLLVFENGVIVIKHWKMHNLLRKDRYHATEYQEQYNTLRIKPNGSYTDNPQYPLLAGTKHDGNHLATTWQPNDNQMATEVRLGKDRLGKESIGKCIKDTPTKPLEETKSIVSTESDMSALSEKDADVPQKGMKPETAPKFLPGSEAYGCAEYLARSIHKALPTLKEKSEDDLQRWANDFDKAHRLDKHPWEEIRDVLIFCRKSVFWQKNIMSGATFRKQYERLLAEMTYPQRNAGNNTDFMDLV